MASARGGTGASASDAPAAARSSVRSCAATDWPVEGFQAAPVLDIEALNVDSSTTQPGHDLGPQLSNRSRVERLCG